MIHKSKQPGTDNADLCRLQQMCPQRLKTQTQLSFAPESSHVTPMSNGDCWALSLKARVLNQTAVSPLMT